VQAMILTANKSQFLSIFVYWRHSRDRFRMSIITPLETIHTVCLVLPRGMSYREFLLRLIVIVSFALYYYVKLITLIESL